MPETGGELLSMRGIDKAFHGVKVLDTVALDVGRGEVVALLGANGAGKSTLVKILSGVYSRDAGEVFLEGKPVTFLEPADALQAGVKMLPQEICVIPDLTVEENICIGDLPLTGRRGFSHVDRKRMRAIACEIMDQLGMGQIDPRLPLRTLKVSVRRVIEIARALTGHASLLIMDEPTAALSESERKRLFAIIRRVKERGIGVVYISHYLDEVFAIADRVTVLRDGRNAGDFVKDRMQSEAVLAAMLGRKFEQQYPARVGVMGETVFSASGFAVEDVLSPMDFTVKRGEIVGLHGLIGSGIERFARLLCGAERTSTIRGEFTLAGSPYRPRTPEYANARGIGFVPPDRKCEAILPDLTLRENITIPVLNQFRRLGGFDLDRRAELESVMNSITELDIKTTGPEQKIRFLSGGNQQKACLARWLGKRDLELLILQEPTYGVDIGARRDIYELLTRLTRRGVGILAVSTDVEEACGMSDRILVLRRGRLAGEFARGATPGEVMHAAAGTGRSSIIEGCEGV